MDTIATCYFTLSRVIKHCILTPGSGHKSEDESLFWSSHLVCSSEHLLSFQHLLSLFNKYTMDNVNNKSNRSILINKQTKPIVIKNVPLCSQSSLPKNLGL
jgi:hypothetical protein